MNKEIVNVIYPKNFEVVSMDNFVMMQLFLNELIFLKIRSVKFHVNNKIKLIECNDIRVKKTLDVLLKAGKLAEVRTNTPNTA